MTDPGYRRRRLHRLQLHTAMAGGARRGHRRSRQTHLRRQSAQPRQSARRRAPISLCAATSTMPELGGAAAASAPTARGGELRRRKPRRPLHPRASRVRAHQYPRALQPAGSRARLLGRARRRGEAAAFASCRVSTDEVYGSLGREGGAVSRSQAYAPTSPYAASKAAADHMVGISMVRDTLHPYPDACFPKSSSWTFPSPPQCTRISVTLGSDISSPTRMLC